MSRKNDRTVFQRAPREWVNKLNNSNRASTIHDTQAEANSTAGEMLRRAGGGERTTMGRNGKIVSKDTIEPGRESSIKDREH